jgi:hypothetical protein
MTKFECVILSQEDWPEWYTLGFLPRKGGRRPQLVLSIAEKSIESLVAEPHFRDFIARTDRALVEQGEAEEFKIDPHAIFGYKGVMRPQPCAPGSHMITYHIGLPEIETRTRANCRMCGGTGRDYHNDCMTCDGDGREKIMEWKLVRSVVATLHALQAILDVPVKSLVSDLPEGRNQLVSICTGLSSGGLGHAGMSAQLSREFSDYLRVHSNKKMPGVEEAMRQAYFAMFPSSRRFEKDSFCAQVAEGGRVSLCVPGQACDLAVYDAYEDQPLELGCHNVDSDAQTLALLCGLAALTAQARKDLSSE